MKRLLLLLLAALSLPITINSENLIVHGGCLNGEGCHNETKNDNYNCHRSTKKENLNSNYIKNINFESCYDGDTCTSTQG